MGTMVSFTARHEVLGAGDRWMGMHLTGVVITALTVMVPLGGYLLLVFPTWSTLYLFDPSTLSYLHMVGLLLALPLASALGYMIGISLCKFFGTGASIALFVLSLAAMIVMIGFFPGELYHVSKGLDWKDAPSLFSGELVAIFAFSFPLVLGGWLFIFTLYEVEGRKIVRASTVGTSSSSSMPSFSPPISVAAPESMEKEFIVPDLASDKGGEQSPKATSPKDFLPKEHKEA